MVAKAPGVVVLPGNMTGSAPTVRIRGIKSVSLSSDPIYVIDGIRMNSGAPVSAPAARQVSLLNTLNPEEISDIEIVKGPVGGDAVRHRRGERRHRHHDEEGPGRRHALELAHGRRPREGPQHLPDAVRDLGPRDLRHRR